MSANTETALAPREEQSTEVAISAAQARERYAIQSAFIIARENPRDEQLALNQMLAAVELPMLAEKAQYAYPRGTKKVRDPETGKEEWVENIVKGPSVYLTREFARVWGNLDVKTGIIADEANVRQVVATVIDLQTNTRFSDESRFGKLVQKKIWEKQGGRNVHVRTDWVEADERNLLEITNKHTAKLERNCTLKLIPKYFVDAVCAKADKVLLADSATNLAGSIERLPKSFLEIGVTAKDLERYLGHALAITKPEEVVRLRQIYASIKDGNSRWSDYESTPAVEEPDPQPPTDGTPPAPKTRVEELKQKMAAAKAEKEAARAATEAAKEADLPPLPVDTFDAACEGAGLLPEERGQVIDWLGYATGDEIQQNDLTRALSYVAVAAAGVDGVELLTELGVESPQELDDATLAEVLLALPGPGPEAATAPSPWLDKHVGKVSEPEKAPAATGLITKKHQSEINKYLDSFKDPDGAWRVLVDQMGFTAVRDIPAAKFDAAMELLRVHKGEK